MNRNWYELYDTWDKVGQEYSEPIPPDLALTQTQIDFMTSHGFDFVSQLGKGGFGVVWKVRAFRLVKDAYNQYMIVLLACKVSSLAHFQKNRSVREAVTALIRESDILSQLKHSNIIQYEHVFHVDDQKSGFPQPIRLCLFMELCDGDLRSLIEAPPKYQLTEDEAHQWFIQIVKGLKYLRENNVAHMDLKPHNILYKINANQYIYKLCYFGLSKMFKTEEPMTAVGKFGTKLYQSPQMSQWKRFNL